MWSETSFLCRRSVPAIFHHWESTQLNAYFAMTRQAITNQWADFAFDRCPMQIKYFPFDCFGLQTHYLRVSLASLWAHHSDLHLHIAFLSGKLCRHTKRDRTRSHCINRMRCFGVCIQNWKIVHKVRSKTKFYCPWLCVSLRPCDAKKFLPTHCRQPIRQSVGVFVFNCN